MLFIDFSSTYFFAIYEILKILLPLEIRYFVAFISKFEKRKNQCTLDKNKKVNKMKVRFFLFSTVLDIIKLTF